MWLTSMLHLSDNLNNIMCPANWFVVVTDDNEEKIWRQWQCDRMDYNPLLPVKETFSKWKKQEQIYIAFIFFIRETNYWKYSNLAVIFILHYINTYMCLQWKGFKSLLDVLCHQLLCLSDISISDIVWDAASI